VLVRQRFPSAANARGGFVRGLSRWVFFALFFPLPRRASCFSFPPPSVTVAFYLKGNGECNFQCSPYPLGVSFVSLSLRVLRSRRQDAGEMPYAAGSRRSDLHPERDPAPHILHLTWFFPC